VGAGDELETIDMIEFGRNLVTKEPAGAARRNSPRLDVLRIRPDEVAECTFVWDLLSACNHSDLVNSSDLRTESTMNTQDLSIHDSGKYKEVKNLAAGFPDRSIAIFCLTLLIEAVNLSDLSGFVIATDQGDFIGKPKFVSRISKDDETTYKTFRHMSKVNVSREKYPRSTKSPRKMKF